MGKIPATASAVMLSTLTEEAVDIAYLSFQHQSTGHKGSTDHLGKETPILILNIKAAGSSEWLFHVPSAPWKRICLNLVMNALKYTRNGFVSITLRNRRQSKTAVDRERFIELIVSAQLCEQDEALSECSQQVEDSGIGMSRKFLDNDLFRAFKQENSLAPGTGLVSCSNVS